MPTNMPIIGLNGEFSHIKSELVPARTDLALRVNVARHDAHFALARANDTRAVWPNQPRLGARFQSLFDLYQRTM